MHLTLTYTNGYIRNDACTWSGAFTVADLTCTGTIDVLSVSRTSVYSTVFEQQSVRTRMAAFAVATVVQVEAQVTRSSVGATATQSTGMAASMGVERVVMAAAIGIWAAALL